MPSQTKVSATRDTETLLANIVRQILSGTYQVESVDHQAAMAGYSRAHWSRLFAKYIGEPPASFLRRIQIERACSLLLATDEPVKEIASAVGFEDPSSFGRSFRRQLGCTPLDYRAKPPKPSTRFTGIHWVPLWADLDAAESARMNRRFPLQLRIRPTVEVAVRERIGSYSRIGEFLEEAICDLKANGFEPDQRTMLTIYYDNMWTHPSDGGMKADLGFQLRPGDSLPKGFRQITIPGGTYATFESGVARTDRNEAWAWMSGHRFPGLSFDEYEGNPLPWPDSKTRLWVGVC